MATANNQQKNPSALLVMWWEKFIKCRYLKRVPLSLYEFVSYIWTYTQFHALICCNRATLPPSKNCPYFLVQITLKCLTITKLVQLLVYLKSKKNYRTSAITSPGLILFFHFQSPLLLSKIRVLFKVRVLFNVGYYLRSYGIFP